jgi:uncharacterized protein (TIGR02145 family)
VKKNIFSLLFILSPILVVSQRIEVAGEIIADSINVHSGMIRNVANPISAQDAATKAYVDVLKVQLVTLQGVKDIDNNRYEIVTIGTQTWMAENLKTTCYSDGAIIPLVTDEGIWSTTGTNGYPAYSYYDNSSSNLITYGALYNWYSIHVGMNGNKNVCPTNWHVPTDGEWTTLRTYLGGESVANGKMREAGLAHWTSLNTEATNESGFAGLPSGFRLFNGSFSYIGNFGLCWSSTEENATSAWYRFLAHNILRVGKDSINKSSGLSVRCLRD